MSRAAARRAVVLAGLAAWAGACSDGGTAVKVVTFVDSVPGLTVSPPVFGSVATGGRGFPGPASGTLVYVSLAPSSVPTGLQASIRDQATGLTVTTTVLDGGFDPVVIAAAVGDTLLVEITRVGGSPPLDVIQPVKGTRPPVVVRTSPPSGGHDVPLNTKVVIVFSTPIDSATLHSGAVQLWRDTTPVSGTARLDGPSGFRVEFDPDTLLTGATIYDLVITQALHDINDVAPTAQVDVPFATGVEEQALAFASVQVAGGYSCGVTTDGAAYCWGINSEGQLGTTTNLECGEYCSTVPAAVSGNLTFQSVGVGLNHVCGVTTNGVPYCWGSSSFGQLGTDTATLNTCYATPYRTGCPYPVPVVGGHQFRSVSAGLWHSCGLTAAGAAYCWGSNGNGELGADSATLATSCRTTNICAAPVPVSGGLTFAALSAASGLTCGVTTTGAAYCWGADDVGQLGIGAAAAPELCSGYGAGAPHPCSRVPLRVTGGLAFTEVAALDSSACGRTTAGIAYCWGYNGGLLGAAVPLDGFASAPVRVGGNLTFTAFAAGHRYACGVTAGGAAYCWGVGDNGVFGGGAVIHLSTTPVQVAGGRLFRSLSAASGFADHTCGLTTDGLVYCWGANVEGELGNGSTNNSAVPVRVAGQP